MNQVANIKGPMGQKAPKERHTPLERRFYAWMRDNCTCCLTGSPEFQIAHTGGIAQGKGKSRKASLNTCLPLHWKLHVLEEASRSVFWSGVGFPDYLDWAKRLYGNFEDGYDPHFLLALMQDRADRDFIRGLLTT